MKVLPALLQEILAIRCLIDISTCEDVDALRSQHSSDNNVVMAELLTAIAF